MVVAVLRCDTSNVLEEESMGKVIANAVMSLDGYIAKQDNTIGRLFDWYMNGDVECPTARPTSRSTSRRRASSTGALAVVAGRAGLRAHAVRLHRRLGRTPHHGRAGRRGHPPGPDGLGG